MIALVRLLAHALVAIAVATAAAADGPADWPAPDVTWEPAEPDIGDLVMVHLEVAVPQHLVVSFPRLDRDLVGFAVSGRVAAEPEQAVTGLRRWRQSYRLEPQTTGEIVLPRLVVVASDPKTVEEREIVIAPITIPVRSLVPADADFRAIRDARAVVALPPPPGESWTRYAAAIAIALILGLLALWLIRRRPVAGPMAEGAPGEQALAGLRRLAGDDTADNQRFHAELARVLREYVGKALAIDATRRTTTETVVALRRGATRSADPDLLARPLAECDRVKFARAMPDPDDRNRSLAAAIDFVTRAEAR